WQRVRIDLNQAPINSSWVLRPAPARGASPREGAPNEQANGRKPTNCDVHPPQSATTALPRLRPSCAEILGPGLFRCLGGTLPAEPALVAPASPRTRRRSASP